MRRFRAGREVSGYYRGHCEQTLLLNDLLTEREREALAGDASDSYRYKTRTYFRRRLQELEKDIELLEEQDEHLLTELRKVVCED